MDPSHYKSEGVPPTQHNPPNPASNQSQPHVTTTHASSNLPVQRPIYTSENGQKKNVPVAAIKPVVKPQQQKERGIFIKTFLVAVLCWEDSVGGFLSLCHNSDENDFEGVVSSLIEFESSGRPLGQGKHTLF